MRTAMNWPQQIDTERLTLRWAQEADAEEIFARYANDPVVARYMLWSPHASADATREWLRAGVLDREAGRVFNWLILLRKSGRILGSIGCDVNKHVVQFGYCLAQDAWGKGYATEAARAMVPVWLAEPAIWRVQAYCDLENVASARVLEKAGLKCEGTLRRYIVTPNLSPLPRDAYVYARVREK
jgi:RimJ/RimL family protein N-acetyltransferase